MLYALLVSEPMPSNLPVQNSICERPVCVLYPLQLREARSVHIDFLPLQHTRSSIVYPTASGRRPRSLKRTSPVLPSPRT